jgi:hypothetical protein
MLRTPRCRDKSYVLRRPTGEVEEVLRRYDPYARRKRTKVKRLGITVTVDQVTIPLGGEVLARGLRHHLGGTWEAAPPEPGERDEPLQDLIRIFIPGVLLPAALAALLRPELPGVTIREDAGLGLFWFDDPDSELTISAWAVEAGTVLPLTVPAREPMYEVGIDDVHGPTEATAAQAWQIARVLAAELGGIPVDRYGFRIEAAAELLPR